MRRLGLVVSLSLVFAAYGCGSSGGGGTGGGGGTPGTGGAAGGAGAPATGGAAGGAGVPGTGGAAGGAGSKGTGAAGATGTGGAGGALATCGTAVGGGDQCSSVTASATGPCVTPVMATGAVPTALGGTISAGTYQLTATSVYVTSDAGQTGGELISRQTFIVSNVTSSGFTLQQIEASGTATSRDEGTVAISGTTATFTKTCPPPGDGGDQGGNAMFTATSTTVTLITNHGSTVVVQTYTKS
jgi:hypothetical protein